MDRRDFLKMSSMTTFSAISAWTGAKGFSRSSVQIDRNNKEIKRFEGFFNWIGLSSDGGLLWRKI